MNRTGALAIAAASIAAFTIANLHYSDVVDNSRASSVEIAAFLAGWLGGIFGFCLAAVCLLASLGHRKGR